MSGLMVERDMPERFFATSEPVPGDVRVHRGQADGVWSIYLSLRGLQASAMTTRAGIEAVRDACNAALAWADCDEGESGV